MDKFLQVIAAEYVCGEKFSENVPKPDKLVETLKKKTISGELMMEIEDLISEYTFVLSAFSVTQGLKVAAEILNDTYCPRV